MQDTIVGIATASGEGGVAIVRMSGDEAIQIFEKAFRPRRRRPRRKAGESVKAPEKEEKSMPSAAEE